MQWIDSLPPAQVSDLMKQNNPAVRSTPSNDYWYVALNQKKKPFNDARVRQAFAWAIDREAIAQAARAGAAQVNQTAIPRTSSWYYDYEPYRQDPVRAKTLLQQAGVKKLKVDFMVTSEYPETIAVARVLRQQLAAIGVTLNIRTEEFAGWLADQAAGRFDGLALNWLGNLDPDEFYYSQHSSQELYDQAAKIVVDQASYIYLYNPDVVQGWSAKLHGYTVRTDRAIRFRDASLSE